MTSTEQSTLFILFLAPAVFFAQVPLALLRLRLAGPLPRPPARQAVQERAPRRGGVGPAGQAGHPPPEPRHQRRHHPRPGLDAQAAAQGLEPVAAQGQGGQAGSGAGAVQVLRRGVRQGGLLRAAAAVPQPQGVPQALQGLRAPAGLGSEVR